MLCSNLLLLQDGNELIDQLGELENCSEQNIKVIVSSGNFLIIYFENEDKSYIKCLQNVHSTPDEQEI